MNRGERHNTCRVLALLLALVTAVSGVCASPLPRQASPALQFHSITEHDGLEHPFVEDIAHDMRGFTWIATRRSLQRWDGHHLRAFAPEGDKNLQSLARARSLHMDRNGSLWLSQNDGLLHRFDPAQDRFDSFFIEEPPSARELMREDVWVQSDASGNIWLATSRRGVFRLDPASENSERVFYRETLDASRDSELSGLLSSADGTTLWYVLKTGELCQHDALTGAMTSIPLSSQTRKTRALSIVDLSLDRDGNLWVVDESLGPARVELSSGELSPALDEAEQRRHAKFTRLAFDERNRLWIGTRNSGLVTFLPEQSQSFRYEHRAGDDSTLTGNTIASLSINSAGTLWVGTEKGGLNWTHPRRGLFRTYRADARPDTLPTGELWGITECSNGYIWIGSDTDLARFDPRTQRFRSAFAEDANQGLDGQVFNIAEDTEGTLWIARFQEGVASVNPETLEIRPIENSRWDGGIATAGVFQVLPAGDGRFWIGTTDGVIRWDSNNDTSQRFLAGPDETRDEVQTWITQLLRDRTGRLWVATNGEGVVCLGPDGELLQKFDSKSGPARLSDDMVWSLAEDREGFLWIGTFSGGLNRLDRETGSIRRFDTSDGLPGSTAYGIVEDDLQRLWVSTNNGIARLSPDRESITRYGVDDGIQGREFNSYSFEISKAGHVYFGGAGGLTVFDPRDAVPAGEFGRVVISEILLFNESITPNSATPPSPLSAPLDPLDSISLSHRDRVFGFRFAAEDPRVSPNQRYAYRLLGRSPQWVRTDPGDAQVVFTGIEPGAYEFQVRSVGDDGTLLLPGATIDIRVAPPFWQSPVAFAIYLLVFLLGLAWAVSRARLVRRIEREQQSLLGQRVAEQTEELRRTLELESRMERRLLKAQKMDAVGQLAGGIAHDVNNMLTVILGYTSLASEAKHADVRELRGYLRHITDAGRRSRDLVSQMLLFSRSASNKPRKLDVTEHVQSSLRLLRGSSPTTLDLRFDASDPESAVTIDPSQLDQVVVNLVLNARDAVRGTGRVTVSVHEIRLSETECSSCGASLSGDMVEIRCTDDGMGIPAGIRDRVFEPLFTTKSHESGTGMGLSVVHGIVHSNDGHIVMQSDSSGTSFRVYFPPGGPDGPVRSEGKFAPPPLPEAMRVLIVDDEESVSGLLRRWLEKSGVQVSVESDGESGYATALAARRSGTPFDLVLSDHRMPGLSGFQMARRILGEHPDTAIVLMSGHADDVSESLAIESGIRAFVAKPIRLAELQAIIVDCVQPAPH